MSTFAKIDENNIVTTVIVAEFSIIYSGNLGNPMKWIQSSDAEGNLMCYNQASTGDTYDSENKAFIKPNPYPSWQLDPEIWTWKPPFAPPTDGKNYMWSEEGGGTWIAGGGGVQEGVE